MSAAYSSRSYYSRAAFISLGAPDCAATIRGRRLIEGGVYSGTHYCCKCDYYKLTGRPVNEATVQLGLAIEDDSHTVYSY